MTANPVPPGYHTVTPYLVVDDPGALMDFAKKAFGAVETERVAGPDGAVMHGEFRVGDSALMTGRARQASDRTTSMLYLYVADADAAFRQASAAGGTTVAPVTDQFYGDRSGAVRDPFGNQWWVATRKENVSPDELARRMAAMSGAKGGGATPPRKK